MSVKKSGRSKARARVVWDEDNLDYLEANKSPKKKITEPKTPYHAPEDSDGIVSPLAGDLDGIRLCEDSSVDPEAVKNALSQVASSSSNGNGKRWRKSSGWTSSEDETEDRRDRQCFTELRRAHYDEFRRLKLLRSQGTILQEEEEQVSPGNGSAIDNKNDNKIVKDQETSLNLDSEARIASSSMES